MRSDPIRVLHLTDPHLFAAPDGNLRGANTRETLAAVIDHYLAATWRADLIAMTGDVVQDDSEAAYQRFLDLLGPLGLPVHCVPGNHDVRQVMREKLATHPFFYCQAEEVGDWLLIGIDSCVDNGAGGEVASTEMDRLAGTINATTAQHVAVFLHHPPLPMQSRWLDQVGLKNGKEFLRNLSLSGKVRVVLFGHVHQEFFAETERIKIIGTPSTCRQFKPRSEEFALDDMPPAYRQVELFADGSVITKLNWIASDE
ncbi:MAG: metallophosphoesterase [Woeseiaceae bacterium]